MAKMLQNLLLSCSCQDVVDVGDLMLNVVELLLMALLIKSLFAQVASWWCPPGGVLLVVSFMVLSSWYCPPVVTFCCGSLEPFV